MGLLACFSCFKQKLMDASVVKFLFLFLYIFERLQQEVRIIPFSFSLLLSFLDTQCDFNHIPNSYVMTGSEHEPFGWCWCCGTAGS